MLNRVWQAAPAPDREPAGDGDATSRLSRRPADQRLRGKDVLSLRRRPDLKSYWIRREAGSQPAPETMKNQF
jgi:hypothetical protein